MDTLSNVTVPTLVMLFASKTFVVVAVAVKKAIPLEFAAEATVLPLA